MNPNPPPKKLSQYPRPHAFLNPFTPSSATPPTPLGQHGKRAYVAGQEKLRVADYSRYRADEPGVGWKMVRVLDGMRRRVEMRMGLGAGMGQGLRQEQGVGQGREQGVGLGRGGWGGERGRRREMEGRRGWGF